MNVGRSTLLVLALLCAPLAAQATQCTLDVRPDACYSATDSTKCADTLHANPGHRGARLARCETLLLAGETAQALVQLDQGLQYCNSTADCYQLEIARSNVQERLLQTNRDNPEAARLRQEALRSSCLGPVGSSRIIDRCAEQLVQRPDDWPVVASIGSKLMKAGRATEALRYYRRAERRDASINDLAALIKEAQSQRQFLVRSCLSDGDLRDCDEALLRGEPDELGLRRKMGSLYASSERYEDAARAYAMALTLDKGRDTANEVLRTLPGSLRNADVFALRGDANMKIANPLAAMRDYSAALELESGHSQAKKGFTSAATLRKKQIDNACRVKRDKAACENLLVAGLADEFELRDLIAGLSSFPSRPAEPSAQARPTQERPIEVVQPPPERVVKEEPLRPVDEVEPVEIAQVPADEQVEDLADATGSVADAAASNEDPAIVAGAFSNRVRRDGRTH